jgi:hypothetical protein
MRPVRTAVRQWCSNRLGSDSSRVVRHDHASFEGNPLSELAKVGSLPDGVLPPGRSSSYELDQHERAVLTLSRSSGHKQ